MNEQTCSWKEQYESVSCCTIYRMFTTECDGTWVGTVDPTDFNLCPSCGKPMIIEGEDGE